MVIDALKLRKIFSLLLIAILVTSCTKKNAAITAEASVIPETELVENITKTSTQLWHNQNKSICIVFGYGYNTEKFVSETKDRLYSKYGNIQDGGLIFPLVYPDDFRAYITELPNLLDGIELAGIILLGAPEGTHKAIAKIHDSYGNLLERLPFPVFSFFSQDDNIIGMEDSSDFVLDKMQKTVINGLTNTEDELEFVEEVPFIIDNAVRYMLMSEAPLEKKARLFDAVKMIAGNLKIQRYSDPETGIVSINHFLLE